MENIIIIHGAIGASDQMIPLGNLLRDYFKVHHLEFSGHGSKSNQDVDFSLDVFINDLRLLLDQVSDAHIFGYSMGGFVALLCAAAGDTRISSIATLGTKLKWNEEIALKECRMLDPVKIEEKVPAFATVLENRHGSVWRELLGKTNDLLTFLGKTQPINENSMREVSCPVLMLLGDQDEMVSEEETNEVVQWLPNSQFSILENSGHPIERVDLLSLSQKLKNFITV